MIQPIKYKNLSAYALENGAVTAVVLPDLGGKIASFRLLERDFELLFQHDGGDYALPALGAPFDRYDASGFDDAFPNIVEEKGVMTPVGPVNFPDHGEIWSARMRPEVDGDDLILRYDGAVLPYRYEKAVSIDGGALTLDYAIANVGGAPIPILWTAHGLMRIERDMRIFLPDGVDTVLNLGAGKSLGPRGDMPYPIATAPDGRIIDLRRPLPYDEPSAMKFYVRGALKEGISGAVYPSSGVRFTMAVDVEKLPYLGLWMTQGQFRGDYNYALEPSNGFYDGVSTARANGALPMLAPGETFRFALCLTLEAV